MIIHFRNCNLISINGADNSDMTGGAFGSNNDCSDLGGIPRGEACGAGA